MYNPQFSSNNEPTTRNADYVSRNVEKHVKISQDMVIPAVKGKNGKAKRPTTGKRSTKILGLTYATPPMLKNSGNTNLAFSGDHFHLVICANPLIGFSGVDTTVDMCLKNGKPVSTAYVSEYRHGKSRVCAFQNARVYTFKPEYKATLHNGAKELTDRSAKSYREVKELARQLARRSGLPTMVVFGKSANKYGIQ